MSWGRRDPPKHPRTGCSAGAGQGRAGHPLLRLREGEEGIKAGGMSWGCPASGAFVSSPRPFCWQWGFEGPGGSSWGERPVAKAQSHAPALFLYHINKDDKGRRSLLFLFPKCSQGWLRVTLLLPRLPLQAQLSPTAGRP